MGLHSSLKRAEKSRKFRSVWKRVERIKWLLQKKNPEEISVYNLPKIKITRMKTTKKTKAKQEQEKEKSEKSS